jgi:hypothetical protein
MKHRELPVPLERIRRRAVLLSAWLPHVPGDAIRARRRHLPGPYKRIWFFHVRKTAGTSLYRSFLALGGEDPRQVEDRYDRTELARSGDYVYLFVGNTPWITRRAKYFFAYSHKPSWTLNLPSDTFTLTILRDPAQRVISLYRYLSNKEGDKGHRFSARPQERALTSDGFDAFLDRIPRETLLVQLQMFSRNLDPEEAARKIRNCSMYFFTESYEEGLKALSDRLELPLEPRAERVSPPHADEDLYNTPRLRELLEPEYRLLQLLRENPGPNLVGAIPEMDDSRSAR